MRKLNNRGWGLSTMITFLVILLLFILVIAFVSYRFGITKKSPNPLYEIETSEENPNFITE